MIRNKIVAIIISVFTVSCSKRLNNDQTSVNSHKNDADTLNISYYENKKVREIELSEYESEKNVKLYFSESGRLKQKTVNFKSYPTVNYEYDENEKLVHEWREDDIGGCIAISGNEFFWNKNGNIFKEIIHSNLGNSCSEKILIREIKEFFENSKKIKTHYYTRESYEGSEECPCGLQKEFDKNGNITNKKEFIECNSINTECDEKTSDKSKVISSKWYGNYSLNILGQGNREGNEYIIKLSISKDSIIYSVEGYQIYHKFSLAAKESNNNLYLKFLNSQDGTNSWALKKTQDFGKIVIENGKYLWSSPFLNVSFTDNQPMVYQLSN